MIKQRHFYHVILKIRISWVIMHIKTDLYLYKKVARSNKLKKAGLDAAKVEYPPNNAVVFHNI